MTVEYKYLPERGNIKRSIRIFSIFTFAPWMFMCFSLAAIAWVLAATGDFGDWAGPAIFVTALPFIAYFRYTRSTLRFIDTQGALERELSVTLNDHEFTVSDGKNTSSMEYRKMKCFYRHGGLLFLIADRYIPCGTIRLEKITGHEAELIACLRADGMKELHFWSFSRWWKQLLFVAVIAGSLLFVAAMKQGTP